MVIYICENRTNLKKVAVQESCGRIQRESCRGEEALNEVHKARAKS